MEEKQFYESRMFAVRDSNLNVVVARANKFMEGKFVVGVQEHYINNEWIFIISYKVKPQLKTKTENEFQ